MALPSPTDGYEALPAHPPCAFCDGTKTDLVSPFGSVLSVASYWCADCRTPFEYVKWGAATPDPAPKGRAGGGESS